MRLPIDKQTVLDQLTDDLRLVEGVKAIVLGGSFAMGLATDSSDLDIGIYYAEETPFDIEKIKGIAKKYAIQDEPTVTGFYEWGPWVNGGAWITTRTGEVDLLYKNIDQVNQTIEKAKEGIWENHFEQQPPYGFSSIFFLSETLHCLPLYDPERILEKLKQSVENYPPKLKSAVIQQSLWSAEFTLWQAEKFAVKSDVYNTLGCLTRAAKSLVTALFAINERYPIGDKHALSMLEQAEYRPEELRSKLDRALICHKYSLSHNVSELKNLFFETSALAKGHYSPYYSL